MARITKRIRKKDTPEMSEWPFGAGISVIRGEHALWAAVITQAMMDALSRKRTVEAQHYKQEAIHWLTCNSADFITVCLHAGFDPDYIRVQAKRAMANPKPWRAAPGKGKRYHKRQAQRRRRKQAIALPSAIPCLEYA